MLFCKHRFRHTAGRMFLLNKDDAFALRALLGHQNLKTTRLCVEMEREDLSKRTAAPALLTIGICRDAQ